MKKTNEKQIRRSVKEMNATREMVINSLDTIEIPNHKLLGQTSEGLVFENMETGLSIVIRVITKQLNFLAEEEIEDFELREKLKQAKAKLNIKK